MALKKQILVIVHTVIHKENIMLKTKILNAAIEEDLMIAASLIKQGELVAVPTETVYGLAADARNLHAVKKIFIAKDRPSDHPLIVHIASFEKVSEWAQDVPPVVKNLADVFWPGPLTLVLKKNNSIEDAITGGLKTIAIRVPQNKALLRLLEILDTGLAAPSANPHKRISPTSSEHVIYGLSGKIAAVLDSGPCQIGIESTILDLTGPVPKILRHGPITKEMLEEVLKVSVDSPEIHSEKVSGNMKNHYQPYAKTSIKSLEQIKEIVSLSSNSTEKFGVMHYSELSNDNQNILTKKMPQDKSGYTNYMYDSLHYLDRVGVTQILIECPPKKEDWKDVLDRLSKASTEKK